MNQLWYGLLPRFRLSHRPAEYDSAEPSSSIWFKMLQARRTSTSCAPGSRLRKPPSDDPLVPGKRVLNSRLMMVSRLFLPRSPPPFQNSSNIGVPCHPGCGSRARHRGRPRRRNNDPGAAGAQSIVHSPGVICPVTRESLDLAFKLGEENRHHTGVTRPAVRQALGNNHTIGVDSDVERAPAADPRGQLPRTGFRSQPGFMHQRSVATPAPDSVCFLAFEPDSTRSVLGLMGT